MKNPYLRGVPVKWYTVLPGVGLAGSTAVQSFLNLKKINALLLKNSIHFLSTELNKK